jgi:zinc/manganese transport system ATP-binding protein
MTNETIISVRDLGIEFGKQTILDHISFELMNGEFIAILGPNGAGKSTLLKLLLGLLKPSRGDISILGKSPHRGNNSIGYVPQHRVLETDLALRARDVVGFGLDGNRWGIGLHSKRREIQINKALEDLDALHLGNAPVGHLSGGEQQRILIAQALITNPKILLLDEPLSNLDINHGQEIITLLAKLSRAYKVTILLVSHDVNPLLRFIDRVLFMAKGGAVLGTPDQVLTSSALSKLYNTPIEIVRALDRIFVVGAET